MSSYSEYLGRMKQRLPKVQDTRPHRDAGHHTELLKRIAASGTLELPTAVGSCVYTLNAPTTRKNPTSEFDNKRNYAGGHQVQDQSIYNEFTAGQAVAQGALPRNQKTPQIQPVCYSSTVVPEYNDKLAADVQLSAIQASKNAYARGYSTAACCQVCGKPPVFSKGCNCSLTVAQQTSLKDKVGNRIHTSIPNA